MSIALAGCANVRRDGHVFSASVLGFVGDYPGGQHQYKEAFKIDLKYFPDKVAPDCDMLVWYDDGFGKRHHAEAIPHCEQALESCRKHDDVNGEGWCLILLGNQYLRQPNQRQKGLECFSQALNLYRQSTNWQGMANALSALGWGYDSLNQYGNALDCFEKAQKIYKLTRDKRSQSFTLNAIGTEYFILGQPGQALVYFKQALAVHPALSGTRFFPAIGFPDLAGSAVCHDNIGRTYSALGRHKEAIRSLKRAALYYAIFRGSIPVDWCFNRLGMEYESLGHHYEALWCYRWALFGHSTWNRGPGNNDCDGSCYRNLGNTYASLGMRGRALKYYERSLALLREAQDLPLQATTFDTLMDFWSQKQPDLAIFYGKQAVNIYQEIRGHNQAMDKEFQKTYLASHESTFRKLADLLITQGRLPEAEQILDMLKEEEYFEFVRRDSSETSPLSARAVFTPAETEWEKTFSESGDTATALGIERDNLLANEDRSAAEDQQLAAIEKKLAEANHIFEKQLDQLDSEAGNQVRAREQVQNVRDAQGLMETLGDLGPGVVALYTVVCEDKYHVILVTPDVQEAADYTIKSSDLNRKVMDFREALCDPACDPRPIGEQLYKILIAPLEKDLNDANATTLMWSLDGVLRYIPVAALYDGHEYLVERYRNVVFTPASESRLKDPVSLKWKGLGLGVSEPHEPFMALPGVREELQGIFRETGSKNQNGIMPGTVLMDTNFTADAMLSFLHARYPVVHIASHFQFTPGDETSSFLLLGDGHHLTLDYLKAQPDVFRGVELLTLSACDTAVSSENADGREVEGFARLAQNEGAKAVVASLWPVADKSTELLMRKFYQTREANPGMPKAEALRQAQLALLHGKIRGDTTEAPRGFNLVNKQLSSNPFPFNPEAPYSHPYFWSPFILIGNWK